MRDVARRGADELGRIGPISCLAISPDSATLAAGYHDSTLVIWDVATASKRTTFVLSFAVVLSMAFSPDGASWRPEVRIGPFATLGRLFPKTGE